MRNEKNICKIYSNILNIVLSKGFTDFIRITISKNKKEREKEITSSFVQRNSKQQQNSIKREKKCYDAKAKE